jgi:hypothetical protein
MVNERWSGKSPDAAHELRSDTHILLVSSGGPAGRLLAWQRMRNLGQAMRRTGRSRTDVSPGHPERPEDEHPGDGDGSDYLPDWGSRHHRVGAQTGHAQTPGPDFSSETALRQ